MMGGLSVRPGAQDISYLLPRSRPAVDSVRNRRAWPVAAHRGQQLATSNRIPDHGMTAKAALGGTMTCRSVLTLRRHGWLDYILYWSRCGDIAAPVLMSDFVVARQIHRIQMISLLIHRMQRVVSY
jgi:hypothetical protein